MKIPGKDQKGGILIGIIITMVVMGVLIAAMTSMFSSSSVGTVTPSMSNSAYYVAESAYRYVLFKFLQADKDDKFSTLKDDLHDKTVVLEGNKKADIDIEAFWFIVDSTQPANGLRLETPVSLPREYISGFPSSGYLVIDGSPDNPVQYTSFTENAGKFDFTLSSALTVVPSAGTSVFPAAVSSTTTAITEGITLTGSGAAPFAGFPNKNGAIILATTSGGLYLLLYNHVSSDNTQLVNVKSAANFQALPSGGLQGYGGISYISLLQNARITVTGYGGEPSSSMHAERKIEYYQPMVEGTVVAKHEFTDTFDNGLANWRTGSDNGEVGSHGIAGVDNNGVQQLGGGDNAMKVTGTMAKTSTNTSGLIADYYGKGVQESLVEYRPNIAGFEEIWNNSDEKLSYDIQVKVAFTEDHDYGSNNPMGTYMPGIVFRSRMDSDGTREYYGLSFMRGMFAKDQNGDPVVTSPDADDIPDQDLFGNNGNTQTITGDDFTAICANEGLTETQWNQKHSWNDIPPISGVPYMLLWQQVARQVNTTGGEELQLDWLSYSPLCKITPVTIYHYPGVAASGEEDWVSCDNPLSQCPSDWEATRERYWVSTGFWPWQGYWVYYWDPDDPPCARDKSVVRTWWSWGKLHAIFHVEEYDCAGACGDSQPACNAVASPEGYYLGPLVDDDGNPDPRPYTTYNAYKLEIHDEYGDILQHERVTVSGSEEEFSLIGRVNNDVMIVRDPGSFNVSTQYRGNPVEDAAFIFPDNDIDFQKAHNYRVYLKPWVTLMARIIEMKGEYVDETAFDGHSGTAGCGNSSVDRVNVIQAWFGDPDENKYPRGEIRWPDENSAGMTEVIWPDRGYTSKLAIEGLVCEGSFWHCLGIWNWEYVTEGRLCERGSDQYTGTDEKRSPYVMSGSLTTEDYDAYPDNRKPGEVGLHTFGIDANAFETVFFDDFGLRIFEYGDATGVLSGVQSE